ncbi:heptaprenyl diphosphate synthase [Desulfotomaculum arcticum]|uniref:Heptaprenyl diphosphate synthase n=1 Tax=Desulfotruncus arcticus DSM 17038 TaxID=1121424 RepID=A0A1I2R236_9FIRM|nr:Gx transporter family protein [Desulfotruncus arcticus]SFG34835.1 heptaprenyl diphosphate synthase [Desulfotomaculum arcticum] [Desulfotruncus arcticus DSM 17038]
MEFTENMTSTKKLAVIAILVAQASVLHFLESLLPNPLPIPGVKLGLANIITLLALIVFDFKTALQITVLRAILGSLLSGTLFGMGFFMSFSGAVTAALMMGLLLRFFKGLGMVGISIAGAAAHNLGQLVMAALILRFAGIFFYLPFMLLFSVPTGFLIGLLTKELVGYIKATNRFNSILND